MILTRTAKANILLSLSLGLVFAASTLNLPAASPARRQVTKPPPASSEQELLNILASSAQPGEKAVACKKLAIYGTDQAVPALAALLPDPALSSWARIGLEAIPGGVSAKALRDALPKLQGRLLIGVINSVAVRQDGEAVPMLIKALADTDLAVASAAAEALGKIGGDKATKALQKAVAKGPAGVRPAAALGCSLAADRYMAAGKTTQARKVYDTLRTAPVPRQRVLEATRGAVLARGKAGIPMLTELLRSAQKDLFAVGLSTARELPGQEATTALAAEMSGADASRAPLLLLALADRNDSSAEPAIFNAAKSGPASLRTTALPLLERVGGLRAVPVLLDAATENDPAIAKTARAALVALQDNGADTDLLRRLTGSSGPRRQVLLQTAAPRLLTAAVPEAVTSLRDADPGVRKAAVQALSALGGAAELNQLVALDQQAQSPADREPIEAAILAISGRAGAAAVPALLKLSNDPKPELRITSLHALASAGGQDALNELIKKLEDSDESVQDEAVRTLANWPSTWPEDKSVAVPLLAVSRAGKKPSHQVLALRAYLQHLQSDKKLKPEDRIARLNEVLSLIRRPEEKRLAISVATDPAAPGTLAILSQFAADTAVADDAFSAIVDVASKTSTGISSEDRRKALQQVVDSAASEDLKKTAQEQLKKI